MEWSMPDCSDKPDRFDQDDWEWETCSIDDIADATAKFMKEIEHSCAESLTVSDQKLFSSWSQKN